MKKLQSVFQLFFPSFCSCCENTLLFNETIICTDCRHDLPFFDNKNFVSNPIQDAFMGRISLKYAGALFEYRKKGKAQKLIHNLKYKDRQDIGVFLGNWLGTILTHTNTFSEIDCIIPVPLHPKKKRKRGYNQLTKFGKALSHHLQIDYVEGILLRTSKTETQTYKKRLERFRNTETKFELIDNLAFRKKHILLIDDVITTGATVESCYQELIKTPNITISVLAMAFTV